MLRLHRVLAITGAIIVGGCFAGYYVTRTESPRRQDFDLTVFKVYPGSTLLDESFDQADRGRTIHMESFDEPLQLRRDYEFAYPIAIAVFDNWISKQLPPPGWSAGTSNWPGHRAYSRTIHDRRHYFEIETWSNRPNPNVKKYRITYSIR